VRFSGYSALGPGLAAIAAALCEHIILNGVILAGCGKRAETGYPGIV
jgi:hypothetical protein